jgi:hypothetical protein
MSWSRALCLFDKRCQFGAGAPHGLRIAGEMCQVPDHRVVDRQGFLGVRDECGMFGRIHLLQPGHGLAQQPEVLVVFDPVPQILQANRR